VHLRDELIHVSQLFGGGFNDHIHAFANYIEFGVGYKDGDFDEHIFLEGKTRHLAINPD
jgi:hypothetical protein